jgi:thiosulfate/3-mercaptopyruvate sulfurtransferase
MLISAEELNQHLNDDNILIIDARSYKDYSNAHIPGAVNLDLFAFHWIDTSEEGISSFNEQARRLLSFVGIDQNKKVIFYDDKSGMLAARGVWLCLYFSHPDTSMLDGGFSLWSQKNYKKENSQNHFLPSSFSGKIDENLIAGFEYIQNNLNSLKVIDARTPQEFTGKVIRAARGGHIPASENIDWVQNLDHDGKFKPDNELKNLYKFDKDKEIVTYCQGAYRAANTFIALKKLGFSKVRVYLGSWGEWGNKLDLAVER